MLIDPEGTEIIGDKNIANNLNDFFIKVGTDLTADIQRTSEYKNYMINIPKIPFSFHTISEADITGISKNMENKLSESFDGMSNKFIKLIMPGIVDPLTKVINMSITHGIFPDEMKLAKIIPLYKSGSEKSANNYWPISILATLSKILEKEIYFQLEASYTDQRIE